MKKLLIMLIASSLLVGCSEKNEGSKKNNEQTQVKSFEGISIIGDSKHREVIVILRPLLEGALLEKEKMMLVVTDIIENLTFNEDLIQDLREYMLLYYTEELVDETCALLEYKYNNVLEIKEFTTILYENSFWNNVDNYSPLDFSQFEIIEVYSREKDRIRVTLRTYIPGSEEKLWFSIVIEREGDRWYLSELVFSRYIIQGLGRVYNEY